MVYIVVSLFLVVTSDVQYPLQQPETGFKVLATLSADMECALVIKLELAARHAQLKACKGAGQSL
ncbi:hypothetical protein D3C81_2333580 [compost metagenome]